MGIGVTFGEDRPESPGAASAARSQPMMVRRALACAIVLLLAIQVLRNSAVDALAELHPQKAASLWPGHPDVEISEAMREIAEASRVRKPISGATFALIDDAALKAPLSPEPFLVRGVQAAVGGDKPLAGRYFAEAQRRDPRSMAAAYFLSDYYFRSGQALAGLEQATLLARLSPTGTRTVAPFVAVYARDPANWSRIRTLFGTDQRLEDHVLLALARDPRNARTVLALADSAHRNAHSLWLRPLVEGLARNGEYALARQIWASVSKARTAPGSLVYDAAFSDDGPPPPFNWSLDSSTTGIAERETGRGLHILYYGRDDGVLASQLLVLPPGGYRLRVKLGAAPVHPDSLVWTIRCDKSASAISSVHLDVASKQGWAFQVPQGCAAQRLELSGKPSDIPQQADVILSSLTLEKATAGA